jgi:hypothetical protein
MPSANNDRNNNRKERSTCNHNNAWAARIRSVTMGGPAEKIRKRKREEHRKKKEEERRRQEEQRKAEEAKRKANLACDENDGYSRVYGKYGWQWINNKDKKNTSEPATNAQTSLVNNEEVARPPAMRSLDNELGTSSFAAKTKPILSNGASGTVSFLSNSTVEASPLSDVTCSQSPSKSSNKPRAVAFSKPKTIKEENDEAVDPIMAIMMRKEAEKAKMKVADSPSSLQSNSSMNNERRLSQEGARKQAHDPMQIARKKEEERAKTKDEPMSEEEDEREASPRAEARNPFALMRNEDRRSFSPGSAGPVQQAPAADLWEDSEEEEETKEAKNKKKKQKKRGRPKKNPPPDDDDEQAESPPAKKSPAQPRKAPPKKKASLESAPRHRKSREQDDDSSASDIDSDSDIDCEQDDVLIPSFRDPKMGPPSALEPMELPRAKEQNTVHVIPASINRYLRGYQQQGVTFMYSCIMRKSGGILGDDMGLVRSHEFCKGSAWLGLSAYRLSLFLLLMNRKQGKTGK